METPAPFSRLLANARSGDDAALAALLERITPELRRRIIPRIGPRYRSSIDEDDVLQVTFIEAFIRFPAFEDRGEDAFMSWLLRISENNLRDAIRARGGEAPQPECPHPARRPDRLLRHTHRRHRRNAHDTESRRR
ncbi:MAG: RNA polymerase sigma factor [Phycisphaerales bacterium]